MLFDTLYYSKEYVEKMNLPSEVAAIEPPIPLTDEEKQEIGELKDKYRAPLLHAKASVSSGTYIRSLVSDIGKAMRTSCYMTKLIRIQQQEWSLEKNNVFKLEDFTDKDEQVWAKVLEIVLEKGSSVNIVEELKNAESLYQQQIKDLKVKETEDLAGATGSTAQPVVEETEHNDLKRKHEESL